MRCSLIRFAAAFLVLACAASPSQAGDGKIVGNKLDLSVTFAYPESDPDAWRPLFEESSRLLYNATNGQLQLGTIHVAKCSLDKPGADIWILDGFGGAFANPLALGGEGHVYLSQIHKTTSGTARGQFGFVHELGHYVFGMFDEYKGLIAPGAVPAEQTESRVPNQFCTTDLDPIACLMDGGTTVAPNNARTEFCSSAIEGLSTAHNAANDAGGVTYINWQESLNGESCWETMARTIGLSEPSVVQTSEPPGLEPIVWENLDDTNRVVIAIDRSGSMDDEIELARESARQLIDLLHARRTIVEDDGSETIIEGENVAIISFADDVTVEFAMQEIVDENVRDQARQSLENIEVGGETDVALALLTALNEITSVSPTIGCSEAALILSDGRHTNPDVPPGAALPGFVDRGVGVYSVALGGNVDLEFLRDASEQTGGLFFYAAEAEDLPEIFTQISAAIRSGGTIVEVDGEVSDEGRDILVLVDRFSEEVTAIVTWIGPALDLTLTTPTGEVIDVASAATRPDVEAIVRDGFVYLRVSGPAEGEWTAFVKPAQSVPVPVPFDATILTEGRVVDVVASSQPNVIQSYEPTRLRVDVVAGVPVTGAVVTGIVQRPLVGDVAIELFDDGDPAHGDDFAGDGVYQALFDQYTINGFYTYDILVVNVDGAGPDPELPFVEDGADPTPIEIPPFQRIVELSVLVDNVFEWSVASIDFAPETLHGATPGPDLTCYIELESGAVEDIDVSTIRLHGLLAPLSSPVSIEDHDGDGVPALVVVFDRDAVLGLLDDGVGMEVEVIGALTTGDAFRGTASLCAIDPTGVVEIAEPIVVAGSDVTVSWPLVAGAFYEGYLSVDGGQTWGWAFGRPVGQNTMEWQVVDEATTDALILVFARNVEGLLMESISEPFEIVSTTVNVPDVPVRTEFLGVAPNPTFGTTALTFSLAGDARVSLAVFDVTGRLVRRLADTVMPAGTHDLRWDGRDETGAPVSSGVYYYAFETDGYKRTGRLLMIR